MIEYVLRMKQQFAQFIMRWALNVAGIFVASLFFERVNYQGEWQILAIAALVLSTVNALIKPLLVILALPALIVTLGIFSIVINGFMVYLVHILYGPFEVQGFMAAILTGMVIGLMNYVLTRIFDILVQKD